MNSKSFPKSRTTNILTQRVATETLVYSISNDKAYCLNKTSSLIWHFCDGKSSAAEIAGLLSEELNAPVSEDVVWLAIDQFQKDGLLEDGGVEIPIFKGLSRREAIRKIGLVSAIALPLISSIAVPTVVSAQSCLGNGETCSPAGTPCCSGLTCSSANFFEMLCI